MASISNPNPNLKADLAALGKLAVQLDTEGEKIPELLKGAQQDIVDLGAYWQGANYEHFCQYFGELFEGVEEFQGYARAFGELLHADILVYERLGADIDARMRGALSQCH